jgi:hypothetical protein
MSLLLSGSDGLSDVDGTAATPAIRGTDANTGIFFPAADTIAFSEGGAESARFDNAGNFGLGVTPSAWSGFKALQFNTIGAVAAGDFGGSNVQTQISNNSYYDGANFKYLKTAPAQRYSQADAHIWYTASSGTAGNAITFTQAMTLDSSNNLFVGKTSAGATGGLAINVGGRETANLLWNRTSSTITSYPLEFQNGGSIVGFVSYTNTGTTYTTSSDYRLKENVAPMTGALEKVAALKPCTYTWKADGSAGQGFIAHELQAVVPDCVTGAKDAVETVDDLDAEGRKIGTKEVPRYQGVDTSFLVATLVAAIQELKSEFDAYKATHP